MITYISVTYEMGLNQFADLTAEEFFSFALGVHGTDNNRSLKNKNIYKSTSETPLRKSVDWRSHGLVTKVKNQGSCGSCWSFSATGSIEGQYAKKTGKIIPLSEQNLIDCSSKYGNHGCNGGIMDNAFDYVKANGIASEAEYPYEHSDFLTKCRYNKHSSITSISHYINIKRNNENDLQHAIDKIGSISVAIHVKRSMQFYIRGVYYDPLCSSLELNHGVLAVEFGTDSKGVEYYIVKNSWGPIWGEQGYIRMARNKHNNCDIATMASFPIIL